MKTKKRLKLPLALLVLTQAMSAAWAVSPPNPTSSDTGFNTAGGKDALLNNVDTQFGNWNTAFGYQSLHANTNGKYNSGFGMAAMSDNTLGSNNTAVGTLALRDNTTASDNTALGSQSLILNTTGYQNTAVGAKSLNNNTTAFQNTAVGAESLFSNTTGRWNTAVGTRALNKNVTGQNNTAVGIGSLFSNTFGISNTAMGASALKQCASGQNNTAIGMETLFSALSNSNNTALGYRALRGLLGGTNNTALGIFAGDSLVTGTNNIYIGHRGLAMESNTIHIGASPNQTKTFIAGIRNVTTGLTDALPVFIGADGQLGIVSSSERYKKDIKDMADSSRRLLDLRPVTYRYKETSAEGGNTLEYGLVAEEVAKVYPDLVVYGEDGKVETVQYHKLTPMLVNEVIRMDAANTAQAKEIADLKQHLSHFKDATFQEMMGLRQQVASLQVQANHIEALASRLARIEAKQSLGMAQGNY